MTPKKNIVWIVVGLFLVSFTVGCSSTKKVVKTPEVRGDRLAAKALTAVQERRYLDGVRLFRQARSHYRLVASGKSIARVNYNLGALLHRLTLDEQALKPINQSLERYQHLEDTTAQATVLLTRASVLQSLGRLEQARDDLKRSSSFRSAESLGPRHLLIEANIKFRSGEFDKAKELTIETLRLFKVNQDKEGISASKRLLSRIYKAKGNGNQALEEARKAFEIDREHKEPIGIMESLHQLGELYLSNNQRKRGKNRLLRAKKIATKYGLEEKVESIKKMIQEKAQ